VPKSELDASSRKPVRVAVLNTHPIQYFAPLYAYLTRFEPSIELTALYCSDYSLRGAVDDGFEQKVVWDVDLLEGYRSVFLGAAARTRIPRGFLSLIVPQVWREIRSGRYDVLWLHGYGYLACVIAFLAARSMRMPILFRGETHLRLARSGWRRRIRDQILKWGFARVDAFLAIGSQNLDYYRQMGIAAECIHIVPYAVDNQRFITMAAIANGHRDSRRAQLGFTSGVPVVLYASKLVERKHPQTLIRAISRLQRRGKEVGLCMVGSGPMENALRELAVTLQVKNIHFLGFRNQSELPSIYAACDVFVLAAESEPWGLVVNEVMCAGLPVIVSDELGCAADLVQSGRNGWTVPAGDDIALAEAIGHQVADPATCRRMGQASLARIENWGFAECKQGLMAAIQRVSLSTDQQKHSPVATEGSH